MENDKFVCLVEPSKLEYSIISSSSANSNEMSGQLLLNSVTSSASDMGAYEGFSSESVMSLTLTLFNPYSYSINFVISCNNPGHYSLKTSKGTIESKCETKIKLRIKPDFLNELVKKVRDINVEEVEQYEDIFQVKYIRSLDKKEAMRAIKSTIKVVFKPLVITTSPPSPPSNQQVTESQPASATTKRIPSLK
ncbi:hypothetical protein C9374_003645 [Naegleria lovaniensis]|uniref:MSP domain-containing protein n=1 Tax=Naegleria lovaniensis TaxID=51637 RepID=A0AA88H7P4_NAELO|nr:uncharacterized protein C9374_003645 [Naegleria lovaniensis]KAG2393881.1 hypothetical protein C9374_003645 [Naegleria lovaniensis]